VTPAGVVTLFAGSGGLGSADGIATAARFFSPRGIDIDPVGNLYVADSGNHCVRKITPDGEVTTLSGSGPGFLDGSLAEARFSSPGDVAVGPDGSVYVADTSNHRIRRIAMYGEVTTYAGSELHGHTDGSALSARLNRPTGLAVSRAGELFIADSSNRAIRMIRVPPLD
jgi:DNA-binding beta-propeller fold protein YncE